MPRRGGQHVESIHSDNALIYRDDDEISSFLFQGGGMGPTRAHSVMSGLMWNVRALGKAGQSTIVTHTLFTSPDDPMNSKKHPPPPPKYYFLLVMQWEVRLCFISFADN